MGVFNVFIVSKSGGLIYHHDHNLVTQEVEKTFGYPLDIKLQTDPNRVFVMFGQRDGIAVGHSLLAVNGVPIAQNNPRLLDDGREVRSVPSMNKSEHICSKYTGISIMVQSYTLQDPYVAPPSLIAKDYRVHNTIAMKLRLNSCFITVDPNQRSVPLFT